MSMVFNMMSKRSGGSGGGAATPKDVNFYDYDGTLLHSYALSELPLSALPAGPDHSGNEVPLTFQRWNYTLAQVNACTTKMDVGATLIPTDGKTHLMIEIATEGRMAVPLYIQQSVAYGVSINWGDGSAAQTLAGTGNVNTTHTYTTPGRYHITLSVASGCTLGLGAETENYCVMGSYGSIWYVYINMLQAAYIGANVTSIGAYAFCRCLSLTSITIPSGVTSIGAYAVGFCYSLTSITIPSSVTSIGNNAVSSCYSLTSITIPSSVTSIGAYAVGLCYSLTSITIPSSVTSIVDYMFYYSYSLANITIPSGVTSIGAGAFLGCYSLANITIPSGVTSIGNNAFTGCRCMAIYDFSACTSVPALENVNAFSTIPSDCVMRIPSRLYNTWKAATNWSTYASYMVSV